MPPFRFLERIRAGQPIVLDGATGTNLQSRGLPAGTPSDIWVMDNPAEVLRLHRDFIAAGSDIILTNSFGSSRLHLVHAGLEARFEETNRRAVALAREAANGSAVLVAGSLGPLGEMVEPVGTLGEAQAEAEYADQARLLAEGGVDLLVIETQFDLNEALAAVRGIRSVCDLPLVCSFSYDRGMRTMMGVRPTQTAKALADAGLAAIGVNCGRSLDDNFKVLEELRAVTQLPIWFKPNAGLPRNDPEGRMIYDTTPQMMGEQAPGWLVAGAQLVGGCCGTSPEHLRAISHSVRTY
jgi:5-methyltetrahydrofolate--homocysteine methyltransferase